MRSHKQQHQARSALLVSRARRMLHAPTPSEEALWLALRGGALGVAFKRQVVLGRRYIADFFAPSVGLVVEVDGGVHRVRRAADRRRDEKLRRLGYRVVRVDAALVMADVAAAVKVVSAAFSVVAFARRLRARAGRRREDTSAAMIARLGSAANPGKVAMPGIVRCAHSREKLGRRRRVGNFSVPRQGVRSSKPNQSSCQTSSDSPLKGNVCAW
jgi:very-short-patch-repair endonuclease